MHRIRQINGIVLKRIDHREADRVYTVFSRELGKIRLMARGGQRITAKVAPHLEPLAFVRMHIVEGKGGYTLVASDIDNTFHTSLGKEDRARLILSSLHLVDLATRWESPDVGVYQTLQNWMEFVQELPTVSPGRSSVLLGAFTLRLAEHIGYRPELEICLENRVPVQPGGFLWSSARGGVISKTANAQTNHWGRVWPIADETLKLLRLSLSGAYPTLLQTSVNQQVLEEYNKVVDSLLLAHFPIIPLVPIRAMCSVD